MKSIVGSRKSQTTATAADVCATQGQRRLRQSGARWARNVSPRTKVLGYPTARPPDAEAKARAFRYLRYAQENQGNGRGRRERRPQDRFELKQGRSTTPPFPKEGKDGPPGSTNIQKSRRGRRRYRAGPEAFAGPLLLKAQALAVLPTFVIRKFRPPKPCNCCAASRTGLESLST